MVFSRIIRLFLLFQFFFILNIQAQATLGNNSSEEQYFQKKIIEKKFDKSYWKREAQKLNYYEKNKKEKKQKSLKKINLPEGIINPNFIKVVLYGSLISTLLFLIIWMVKSGYFTHNGNQKTKYEIDVNLLEIEEIEADLDTFLMDALQKEDYKIAIRIYYLKILKELQLQGKIYWKKYKTNRHYENEMIHQNDYEKFKISTNIFEKVWFGKVEKLNFIEFEQYQKFLINYLNILGQK